MHTPDFHLRIRGDMACFTRPEFSTERLSYDLMTPSAARGVIEAVLWKPAIRWEITSIALLKPVGWIEFRRNEVNSRVSTQNALRASRGGERLPEFFSDEDRAQRNTLALREPDYGVTAQLHMTARAREEDTVEKFRAMFLRRLEKGQQYYQPYLGCREFPATIELLGRNARTARDRDTRAWLDAARHRLRPAEPGALLPCSFGAGRNANSRVAELYFRRHAMILAELKALAVREGLVDDPSFESKPVPWIIVLEEDGSYLGLRDTYQESPLPEGKKGKPKRQASMFTIPRRLGRTSNAVADFLVDKSEYVLGIKPDNKRSAKDLRTRRDMFANLLRDASKSAESDAGKVVAAFLSKDGERERCAIELAERGYAGNDLFTFRVDGNFLHDDEALRAWWVRHAKGSETANSDAQRQCLLCGNERYGRR